MEYKELQFKAKEVNLDEGTFTGYASTFGNVDLGGDVIEKGAFKKTLKESFGMVKVFRDHMSLIGKPLEMKEDKEGLFVKGLISKTALGLETLELMRDGALDALSVGFNTVKAIFDKEKNIRYIKEVKLFEFSVVPWGMNPQAKITAVKSLFQGLNPSLIDQIDWEKLSQAYKIKKALGDEPPQDKRIDPETIQSLRDELKEFNLIF